MSRTLYQSTSGPLFAEFLNGTFASVKKRVDAIAKKWATRYRQDGSFPEASELAVDPGSTILTNDLSDLVRGQTLWRTYFVRALGSGISQALQWKDHERVSSVFEKSVIGTAWGSLDFALGHVAPNSRENVANRLESLIRFWPELDTLQYRDRDAAVDVSLSQIVSRHFDLLLQQWSGSVRAETPEAILSAVSELRKASRTELDQAVRDIMFRLAGADPRVKNRGALTDRSFFDDLWSRTLTDKEQEGLTGFHVGDLKRALYILDEQSTTSPSL